MLHTLWALQKFDTTFNVVLIFVFFVLLVCVPSPVRHIFSAER